MKKVYWEYYHPNKDDFLQMKKGALFVFDACALLSIYSFNESKANNMFSILEALKSKNRIWMPHQFGEEYHRNRAQKIIDQLDFYSTAKKKLDSLLDTRLFSDFREHYSIDEEYVKKQIKEVIEKIKIDIDAKRIIHPDWSTNDPICKKIEIIFENNMGTCYHDSVMGEKIKEIEDRVSIKRQPGLSDNRSLSREKINGDIIGWLQILDYVKETKKPTILVTEETKTDFWEDKKKTNKVFPRRSLIREFFDKTGQLFFILSIDEFLRFTTEEKYLPIYPEIGKEENLQEETIVGSEVMGSKDESQLTNK